MKKVCHNPSLSATMIENDAPPQAPSASAVVINYHDFIDGGKNGGDNVAEPSISVSTTIPVTSPATNRPVLTFTASSRERVDLAISTAYKAFHARDVSKESWSHPSQVSSRIIVLNEIARLLRQNTQRLADLEVKQIGRPKKEMRFQLSRLPEWFEYFASLLRVHEDSVKPFGPGYLNVVKRVPLGVIAQITPFNHPLLITIKKLAPAIAAGNTVVVKPSELAPASIIELAKLCSEAGLPNGVFNVVLGGPDVAQQLISDKRIVKVDFTGGPKIGKIIGAAAGANLCLTTQELGGKAPMVVLAPPGLGCDSAGTTTYDDVALRHYLNPIVNGLAFGAFIASGQTCIAGTRIIAHESIYAMLKAELVRKTKVFKMGDPDDLATTIGPIITAKQFEFITRTVEEGLKDPNLELLCGGKRYTGFQSGHLKDGNYYEPTIIAARSELSEQDMLTLHQTNVLFQTELFGPVVLLIPFRTKQEAIALANDTPYGLGCSIWTNDIVEAHTFADSIHSGIVWINDHHKNGPASPWGGLTKESGIGRENGIEAYHEYTQTKSIVLNSANRFTSDWFQDPNARYN